MINPNLYVDTGMGASATTAPVNSSYNPATTNVNTNGNAYQHHTPSPSKSASASKSSTKTSSFAQKIKNYDLQNNIPTEFRVYTTHGAFLSLTSILILFYLLSTEYAFNLTYTTKERVHVSSTSQENNLLDLEIDMTFSQIPCPLLSIDAFDPNEQRQSLHLDTRHRIWKHRIGKDGRMVGRKSKFEMGMTLRDESHVEEYATQRKMGFVKEDPNSVRLTDDNNQNKDDDEREYCGSCYGAGQPDECCNTCDDVKRAYQTKGWNFEPNLDVKQCHNSPNSHEMAGEGCNIHGIVSLSSGGGNLHVTPGHELENFGKTFAFNDLADLLNQAYETFNVSHTIDTLRFGKGYPGDINQLDGVERSVNDKAGMYQYYFQIVPTEYRFLNGTVIKTNQYSVIEHLRHVEPGAKRGLPGVYFYYEVSPLHVLIEEYRHGWIRFLTSVAAVIGGVLSAMKMMDAYIFSKTTNLKTLST